MRPFLLRAAAPALLAGLSFAQPAQAQTPSVLVSTIGQNHNNAASIYDDLAQAFTTGSHSLGYKVTRVDLRLNPVGRYDASLYSVTIRSDSSGRPGDILGTLTNPATLPGGWSHAQFPAPDGGIDLAADTTYWVMLDSSAPLGSHSGNEGDFAITLSDAQGGAAGWSVADVSQFRSWSATAWNNLGSFTQMIAIHGYAKLPPPPRLAGATVSGDRLRLAFDKDLDPNSVPDAAAFEVAVDGGAPAGPANVGISGRVVTLALAEAVKSGATVTVSYTKPTGAAARPLRSAAGSEVAGFSASARAMSGAQRRVFAGTLAALASRTVAGHSIVRS